MPINIVRKRLSSKSCAFKAALSITKTLKDAGYEAYIVGGWVRNKLMHIPTKDIDIATSASPVEMKKIFDHTIDTGIEFGTVTVCINRIPLEVTSFRYDVEGQDKRHPAKVVFKQVSLEEDAKRRDFSINALYFDPINNRLIDTQNGIADLAKKQIKTIGCAELRFREDRLRILRGIRMHALFPGFTIAKNTKYHMGKLDMRPWVTSERIVAELRRCSDNKAIMGKLLASLEETNRLHDCFNVSPHNAHSDIHIRIQQAVRHMYSPTDLGIWTAIIHNPSQPDINSLAHALRLSKHEKTSIQHIVSLRDQIEASTSNWTLLSFWLFKRVLTNHSVLQFKNIAIAACICAKHPHKIRRLKALLFKASNKIPIIIYNKKPPVDISLITNSSASPKTKGEQISLAIIKWLDNS